MAVYSKLTDFASKDTLPTGSPAKIVKGTEIDDEFLAVKAVLDGKPDTTDVDAAILSARQNAWPVGSVYINAGVTTNPATLLGFGTWVEIGAGKVLVGQDLTDTDFDVLGETGGSKDAVNVSHTHTATTNTTGNHTHAINGQIIAANAAHIYAPSSATGSNYVSTQAAGAHSHTVTVDSAGEDGTGKNVQPYLVVKMWQRTA